MQQKLQENETKSTALVPLNYQPPVVTDKARLTANHRMNIVKTAFEDSKKYDAQKQADYSKLLNSLSSCKRFSTVSLPNFISNICFISLYFL